MSVSRPVLRYHGGKWMLAPWIIENMPRHRTYVEPYGGAGSVLLRKPRSFHEVYNDLNCEIVNLFRILRDRARARDLYRRLRMTPFSREDFDEAFLETHDEVEWARRLIIRSLMGFGSSACNGTRTGFRSNSHRQNTTPAGDWRNYPRSLLDVVERLRGVAIENMPAVEILSKFDHPETLFYLDPPYPHSTRSHRQSGHYGPEFEMSDDEHRELSEKAHGLRGMVMLSGYACPLYDEQLYSDWERVEKETMADGARPRTEVLWLNKRAQENMAQQRMF